MNMIFSVYPFSFTSYFSVFYLINESMFTMLLRHIILELFSQTDIIFVCARLYYNL